VTGWKLPAHEESVREPDFDLRDTRLQAGTLLIPECPLDDGR
jgi:hypothetical protein